MYSNRRSIFMKKAIKTRINGDECSMSTMLITVFGSRPSGSSVSALQLQTAQKPAALQVSAVHLNLLWPDTHKDWFHLTAGSPWHCWSWAPRQPLIDSSGSSILFLTISLIYPPPPPPLQSSQISSSVQGLGLGLHWECSSCFFQLDVPTMSFVKVAARAEQSGGVFAMGKHPQV